MTDRAIAAVNLFGSGAFGFSALSAIVLPTTGEVVNVAVVNAGTFAGAVAFLIGALLTLRGTRTSKPATAST
jgi:hypothetical protein